MEISRREFTMTYVDTCPSELIHALDDRILVFSHINFDHIDINNIKLRQFKDTRTVERKLKVQDYIIDCFEQKRIAGYGTIRWNTQKLALANATALLSSSNLIQEGALDREEKIVIAGESLSPGHLRSLSWYSVLLCQCAREIAIWTNVERKDSGIILMDLLPGDSVQSSRNLNVVRYIIKNSVLDGIFNDQIVAKKLRYLAFGYGSKDGSTKDFKATPPKTISDWITQSFYCKLRCEQIVTDEYYDNNLRFTKLANYLIDKKLFLVDTPFRLTL